jgi:ABC-type transport system involved in multi-copper enzyme maturation permease subunit
MRMIDEKEAKLNILLERQGISKFKYMLSWLFTFIALFLFSIISFILLIYGQTNGHLYLFIINLILFTLSLYSVTVLFATCIKTTKTGATAIKFYNFGSIFLGFAIILPKTNKATKIVFAFIPQINYFMNHWVTFCLGNFKTLSGDLVILRTAKMSYIESIVMFIVDIIFYLGLAIIIQSYKDSGLSFWLYIKSFFTKVSRNDNIKLVNQDEDKIPGDKFEKHFQELSETNKKKIRRKSVLKIS